MWVERSRVDWVVPGEFQAPEMQRTAGPRTADPVFSRAAHPAPSPLRGAPHPDRALLGAPCQGLSFPRDISQVSLPSPLKSPALRRRILSRRLLPGDPEIRRENTSTALSLAKPGSCSLPQKRVLSPSSIHLHLLPKVLCCHGANWDRL